MAPNQIALLFTTPCRPALTLNHMTSLNLPIFTTQSLLALFTYFFGYPYSYLDSIVLNYHCRLVYSPTPPFLSWLRNQTSSFLPNHISTSKNPHLPLSFTLSSILRSSGAPKHFLKIASHPCPHKRRMTHPSPQPRIWEPPAPQNHHIQRCEMHSYKN